MKQPFVVKLTNGLTIAYLENHRHPAVELLGVVKAGGVTEDDDHDGVSHFLEHLLFKGTAKRDTGRLAEDIAAVSAEFNAWTSHPLTAYSITVPSTNTPDTVEIHFDMLMQSILDEEEVEKERSVVQKEILLEQDNPDWSNMTRLAKLVFREHTLRFNILGSEKTIGSMPVERIRAYYRRLYTPANMAYIVVGDFSIREIHPRLEELWGGLPAGEPSTPKLFEPQQIKLRYSVIRSDIEQSVIGFGARIPGITAPGYHALRIGAEILASGKLSRLYKRLVSRERLAWSVHTFDEALADDSLLYLTVLAGKEADPTKIQQVIRDSDFRPGNGGPRSGDSITV